MADVRADTRGRGAQPPQAQQADKRPDLRPVVAYALVRVGSGLAPLRVELGVSEDLVRAEVKRVELGVSDYRPITTAKVMRELSNFTPMFPEKR